ncbi:NB-ARC domain, LRR domain containing protein [Trema orientale]|uniref:NB-ARC domain, LRR domain containing protein n=1 Tax=Trema orientale TaxID=63057 RepID=A0A2P5F471_TREOI|nr:NB-ARC domain, LRR domain containing protein [Trema orientale]
MGDIAASLVCACIQPIWNTTYKRVEPNLTLICGFTNEVAELRRRLLDIKDRISKAEDVRLQVILESLAEPSKSEANEKFVTEYWFPKLKGMYYDVDDVVDKWNTANLMLDIEKFHASKKKVWRFLPSNIFFRRLSLQREIAFDLKVLTAKLESFEKDATRRESNLNSIRAAIGRLKKPTSSWCLSEVYGRDEEKKSLMRMLLCESREEHRRVVKTIPILGMGGVGKTTLAQLVFSDDSVKNHFKKRIWVSAPYRFNLTEISRAIVEEINPNCASGSVDSLLKRMADSIAGERLLLVLDDVWSVEEREWGQLIATINGSSHASSSRILVTTQNYIVAQTVRASNDSMVQLGLLSESDCWSIIRPLVSQVDWKIDAQWKDIRSEFLRKCDGSPLVANAFTNVLYLEKTKERWEKVLRRKIDDVSKEVFIPLLLNYYDLSFVQKHCLSYCSLFPRNYVIEKDDVVELWMSQGYFCQGSSCQTRTPEEEGLDCFKILAKRYLFLDFTKDHDGNVIKFKLHDLVYEFGQFLTRHEHVSMEIQGAEEQKSGQLGNEDARHLTLYLKASEARIPNSVIDEKKNLRTLFVVRSETSIPPSNPLSCDVLVKLTCLRTLNLRHCNIEQLPGELDKLLHLRYLNLSDNPLRKLPNALCYLFNLQTLRLKRCTQLQRLPEEMGNLACNFRHLYIEGCESLEALPKQISRLTDLQTLDMFVVPSPDYLRSGEALELVDLNQLKYLRGRFHVLRCGRIENLNAPPTQGGKLILFSSGRHHYFDDLKLNFEGSNGGSGDEKTVLESLQPHPDLKSLEIRGCKGPVSLYPNWMDSLTCLKRLVISGCRNWESLPPLGKLRLLESLLLDNMDRVENVELQFLGDRGAISFPSLKELHFSYLTSWKIWEWTTSSEEEEKKKDASAIMPCLASLQFSDCGSLEALPGFLRESKHLQDLTISRCAILEQRCREGAQDWDKISHVANVKIDGVTIGGPSSLPDVQATTSSSFSFVFVLPSFVLFFLFFHFLKKLLENIK